MTECNKIRLEIMIFLLALKCMQLYRYLPVANLFIFVLKPRNDIKPLVHPTAHCWTANSDIYMGCKEGHILKIDAETLSACVLQQKPLPGKKQLCCVFYSCKEEDG